MDWSQKEENGAAELWGNTIGKGGSFRDALRAVMSRAVELVAERGGTMAAVKYMDAMDRYREDENQRPTIDMHFAAQGATVATLRRDLDVSGAFLRAQENRLALPVNEALSWAERWERLRLALERPPRTGSKPVDRLLKDADERVQEEGIRALRYRFDSEKKTDTIETLIVERDELRAEVATLQARVEAVEERCKVEITQALAMESERDALRAEVERLKAQLKSANWHGEQANRLKTEAQRRAEIAESRLAAIREAATRASAELRHAFRPETRDWNLVARAIRILEEATTPKKGDAPQEAKITAYDFAAMSGTPFYPCSPTCTHDDADTPGHPERARERSEAFAEESAAVQLVRLAADAGLPVRFVPRPDDDTSAAESDAYERGAEAMRAACWEAVVERLVRHGLQNLREDFKAAIEGAAP